MSTPFANPRQPIVIEIGGQRLRLNANADEAHLEQLAKLVNERYQGIQQSTRNVAQPTLLALVSMDLADELVSARRKMEELREESRRLVAAAEARAREVEQLARRAVAEAIAEIDRTLNIDQGSTTTAAHTGESETA